MTATAVHTLVFDGFADWEPAFALAELRRSGGLEVVSVGYTREVVRSMGGLRVAPDRVLDEVIPAGVRLFLLPGGDAWEGDYPRAAVGRTLRAMGDAGVPVAAICGATIAAARAGLLDDRAHTSNERAYLEQHAPEYRGSARYVDELAVRDRGVITASGAAPVDFAREIFEELGIMSEADRPVWYHLFKHGRMPKPAA
jgi:putative intracellular protease/amidase